MAKFFVFGDDRATIWKSPQSINCFGETVEPNERMPRSIPFDIVVDCLMSRKARLVSLTTYFMDAAEHFKSFARRPDAALLQVLKPLPDSFNGVGLRRDVEQMLIGFSILHDRFRFAVDGENQGSLGFLETLHEFSWIAPECGDGLNVFLDVEHAHLMMA